MASVSTGRACARVSDLAGNEMNQDGDGTNGESEDEYVGTFTIAVLQLESGSVAGVTDTWQTVALANDYVSAVVVCSVAQPEGASPMVARVRNVTSSSFEVKLESPGGSVTPTSVHYVAVEEGVWELPDGGLVEAARVVSDGTNYRNSWEVSAM